MNLDAFLENTHYVDFQTQIIQDKAKELFTDDMTDIEKAEKAFLFVRDEIPHSFDIQATAVTAKASDVLKEKTGICHAKSNLLAALLRSQRIPAGFKFEHLTLADDDSLGYCTHCYNAVYLQDKWVELDARGNKPGVDAQFSLSEAKLAFMPRKEYDEYFIEGIFAEPDIEVMTRLDRSKTLEDVVGGLQDAVGFSLELLAR